MSNKIGSGAKLPDVDWRKATCRVCGKSFDYMSKRRPETCRHGDCIYKFQYGINRESWAVRQFGLFEST